MKLINAIKKTMLIISAAYITIGVLMIINKQASNRQVFEILAYGLAIAGLLSMIRYFMINVKERIKRNDFIVGALLISIAAMIYLSKNDISYQVGKILAIAMIISGFHKIQDLFDINATGKRATGICLFGFVVCVGLGALVFFDIIKNIDVLYILIGLGMCICGISDIVANFYIAYAVTEYEATVNEKTKIIPSTSEVEVKEDEEEKLHD